MDPGVPGRVADLRKRSSTVTIEIALFQFSEWLDEQGLMRSPVESNGDTRSHDELVIDFLAREGQ